jgi:hypothetical protein
LEKAKAKLKMSKENKFEADEYSDEVQNLKKEWEEKKEASKKRMLEYADRIEKGSPVSTVVGGIVGGTIGSVFGIPGTLIGASVGAGSGNLAGGKLPKWTNWKGNTEAARKMREAAEGKDKKDKKSLEKELRKMGILEETEGEDKNQEKPKEDNAGNDATKTK